MQQAQPHTAEPATLAAEVERRRKAAATPKVLRNVTTAAAQVLPLADFLQRSRDRHAAAVARFAPDIQAEAVRACPEHPAIMLSLEREETLDASTHADKYTPVFQRCSVCEATRREARRWARCGVPERVLFATLENYETPDQETADALEQVRAFVATAPTRGGFLLLLGTTGTGKGHLATGAAKEIAPEGGVVFIAHADLLTRLRDSYGTGKTEDFLEHLKAAHVLILDEFGVSVGGKDEAPVLYQILSDRHDKRRPTILTSNEELKTVKALLGFRLMDRIREEYRLLNFTGPSWRTRQPEPAA